MRKSKRERLEKLSVLCHANATALLHALEYCAANGIGCFRINSQILPAKTHPEAGDAIDDLPDSDMIVHQFRKCGSFAADNGLRTVFHPDQFVVLNSPRSEVVQSSIRKLEYQAEVATWIGADVINIHGGGAYGNKQESLFRFETNLDRLSDSVRTRLTVENDDKIYSPSDLLPLCRSASLPLVYDVHHHRCLPDELSIELATVEALSTWNREPLFHISSPKDGWNGNSPNRHHDYIDVSDFPDQWRRLNVTIEVEAKAKELAIARLKRELGSLVWQRK